MTSDTTPTSWPTPRPDMDASHASERDEISGAGAITYLLLSAAFTVGAAFGAGLTWWLA